MEFDYVGAVDKGFNKLTRAQRDIVDPNTLNMDSDFSCVLAQIFGLYSHGMSTVFPNVGYGKRDKVGFEYGFFVSYFVEDAHAIYAALQAEWIRRLTNERELTAALSPVGSI